MWLKLGSGQAGSTWNSLPIISFDDVVQLHYCRSPAAEPEDANLDTASTTKLEDQGMNVGLATKVRFNEYIKTA